MIWLTTSNGIYSYDGKDFDHFLNDGVGQNEFFQPFFTTSNQFFFTSINGDIYTLKDEKISLFKFNNVPNNLSFISLACSGDYLYFLSQDSIYQLDTSRNRKAIYGFHNAFLDVDFKSDKRNPTIQFFNTTMSERIVISGSTYKVEKTKPPLNASILKGNKSCVMINGQLKHISVYDRGTYKNFVVNNHVVELEASTHRLSQWYRCSNQNTWTCDVFEKGLYSKPSGDSKGRRIFADFDINYIFEDIEGAIWLGTRNNGLLLVSNLTNYLVASNEDLLGIDHAENSILTYSSKSLFSYDPKRDTSLKKKFKAQAATIINLFSDPKRDGFYLQYSSHTEYWKSGSSSYSHMSFINLIKDNHWTSDSTGLFSSIGGSYLLNVKNASSTKRIGPGGTRGSSLIYLKDEKKYLLACAKGLLLCKENGAVEKAIRFENQVFNSKFLFQLGGKIIAITSGGKIYYINPKGYVIIEVSKVNLGYIKSGLVINDSTILLTGKRKVVQYNIRSNSAVVLPLHLSPDMQLSNAILFENSIWFSSNKGLIRYQLESPRYKSISSLFMDVKNAKGQIINGKNRFKPNENYFSFKIRCREFRYHLTNSIAYQLEGKDDQITIVDEAEGDIIFKSLLPGNYTFKVQSINPFGVTSEWKTYQFYIAKPYYQQWWFYLIVALLTSLILLLFYSRKINEEKKRLSFERQLKETELKAIKAQMNPHFIFNCLTSIQSLILNEDIESSNKYLGQFSSLVRKTLDYSSLQTLEIEKEIELLQLYLDLENLRFVNLRYSLKHNLSTEDLHELEIPPMLIQPYVENALKHGLLHKKGDKKLELEIVKVNSSITFFIKDNGVGMDQARAIKKKQSKYRSFSGGAISKRLGLINEDISDGKIDVSIQDFSAEQNAEWTTIVIVTFENVL
jgi:anti-sigma regulatory factor (Ser/Thr protein kinase)